MRLMKQVGQSGRGRGDRSRGQSRAGKQSESTWGRRKRKRPHGLQPFPSQAQHLLSAPPQVPAWPGCCGTGRDLLRPVIRAHY